MANTGHLLNAINAYQNKSLQRVFWRVRLLDPNQRIHDVFTLPPQVLYKYIPASRLDYALPDEKLCSLRATPPNELNDINEMNYQSDFVDDESNREHINQQYAEALTALFPKSPVTVDVVEEYRQKYSRGYGPKITSDQLSKLYGITSFCRSRDDVKMWSHYADESRGVVIGYNVDFWVQHLLGKSILKQVLYLDQAPPFLGPPPVVIQENAYEFMSCKGRAWEYEKEWRLITELSRAQKGENDTAVITVPQESVSSIYITDRTKVETIDTIRQRLKNPSNRYRISWIDKLQGGHDANTLSHNGQIHF